MRTFNQNIRLHVDAELQLAALAQSSGNAKTAFTHLERAHVLGQASTLHHVRVHLLMFKWGLLNNSPRECLGQLTRIIGAATKTVFGLVPAGNTGGSNISPFKPLPIPPELAAIIRSAQSGSK
jgi:hypothetical protein